MWTSSIVPELILPTRLHDKNKWILISIQVGQVDSIDFVLDTGSAFNAISQATYLRLAEHALLRRVPPRFYLLQGAQVAGTPLPDPRVVVSSRVTRVGADALLGLDFLMRFTDIHFHVPTMRLTLRRD